MPLQSATAMRADYEKDTTVRELQIIKFFSGSPKTKTCSKMC